MLEMKKCALSEFGECDNQFVPTVYWQKCCTKEHGRRLRWLRRKARITKALNKMEGNGDTPQPTGPPVVPA